MKIAILQSSFDRLMVKMSLGVDLKHRYFTLDKHNALELDKRKLRSFWEVVT